MQSKMLKQTTTKPRTTWPTLLWWLLCIRLPSSKTSLKTITKAPMLLLIWILIGSSSFRRSTKTYRTSKTPISVSYANRCFSCNTKWSWRSKRNKKRKRGKDCSKRKERENKQKQLLLTRTRALIKIRYRSNRCRRLRRSVELIVHRI